tara:strand:- start:779 stop:1366 length:588 start_codon:yes stop_codon:yes gene_type:complete
MSDEKSILRVEARKHRSRIDFTDENPELAADHFNEFFGAPKDKIVAGYWPKGREFDCLYILERVHEQGATCALPVVNEGSLIMSFRIWTPDAQMEAGAYGIAHPVDGDEVEPDIILVPLLAFDRRGVRLGQGGGYYDATIADLRTKKDIMAVGTAYSSQAVLFNLPAEEHDQRLDMVITPKDIHDYTKSTKRKKI